MPDFKALLTKSSKLAMAVLMGATALAASAPAEAKSSGFKSSGFKASSFKAPRVSVTSPGPSIKLGSSPSTMSRVGAVAKDVGAGLGRGTLAVGRTLGQATVDYIHMQNCFVPSNYLKPLSRCFIFRSHHTGTSAERSAAEAYLRSGGTAVADNDMARSVDYLIRATDLQTCFAKNSGKPVETCLKGDETSSLQADGVPATPIALRHDDQVAQAQTISAKINRVEPAAPGPM